MKYIKNLSIYFSGLIILFLSLWNGAYYYIEPSLPLAEEIRDIRLQIPMSIYSRDGRLFAQFGERLRNPIPFSDIPKKLVSALLAAEDDRFYEHPGYDYQGLLRAAINFILSGGDRSQGGSTITQQLARMYFLTRDRTFIRKFKELILAIRIEQEFSKDEILELYFNTYFFGQRAYGVSAASQIYFGKSLDQLSTSDIAILAGIPRAPSILNPVNNPDATENRRAYVLGRMLDLDIIDENEYRQASSTPVISQRFGPQATMSAPYIAEMVRSEVINRFGLSAYEKGLKVTTTIDSRLQKAAHSSVQNGLHLYDELHGYRGEIGNLSYLDLEFYFEGILQDDQSLITQLNRELDNFDNVEGLYNAVVLNINDNSASLYLESFGLIDMEINDVEWARPYLNDDYVGSIPVEISEVLDYGDVVRLRSTSDGKFRLAQLPLPQAALVAIDPYDGAVVSLIGGYDFNLSNFNRASQAKRQPGSAFKPFVYSAALENGYSTASIINDAPIVEEGAYLGDDWRPENYTGQFYGPTRLREALTRSLNLVSIRLVREIGIQNVVNYIERFGFDETALPNNLTIALGSGGISPIEITTGYAIFANGGYSVSPYIIDKIEDAEGNIVFQNSQPHICYQCLDFDNPLNEDGLVFSSFRETLRSSEQVISPQNSYLMFDVMKDVIQRGTGISAFYALNRTDLAGKTGTTNDRRDAWFSGYNANIAVSTWVGFDQERSLGRLEQGARTALPMWIEFMKSALEATELASPQRPPGILDVRINPETGLMTTDVNNGIFELMRSSELDSFNNGRINSISDINSDDLIAEELSSIY